MEVSDNLQKMLLRSHCIPKIDEEGFDLGLLDGIIGHRKLNNSVSKDNGWYDQNGARKRVVTTQGWEICIVWKDGSTSWLPLKEIKSSNPNELAEYAVAENLSDEPAFTWWVPTIMRMRRRMISRLKNSQKIRKRTKFGIVIPTTIEKAKALDLENGNYLW